MPAYYFQENEEVEEPNDAGLYILPSNQKYFSKVNANDKSILYFQVGEFAQLITNDRIKATQHYVKQSSKEIERFTFALFYAPHDEMTIKSQSILAKDERYLVNQDNNKNITYVNWSNASYARYRAK